jgi:hypothetical protein
VAARPRQLPFLVARGWLKQGAEKLRGSPPRRRSPCADDIDLKTEPRGGVFTGADTMMGLRRIRREAVAPVRQPTGRTSSRPGVRRR